MENCSDWIIIKTKSKKSLFFTKKKEKIKIKNGFYIKTQDLLKLQTGIEYVCNKDGSTSIKNEIISNRKFLDKKFKTEHAKDKYVRRKEEKLFCFFSFDKITPYSLSEFGLSKGKMFGIETLSHILWHSAVCAKKRYLVCEEGFLISGSILFKTNGQSTVLCALIDGNIPKREIMFKNTTKQMFSFENVFLKDEFVLKNKLDCSFDSLIISVIPGRPLFDLFVKLSLFIVPSGTLVIYSEYKEALHDIFMYCIKHKNYINVSISECSLRKYVQKKEITHPDLYSNRYCGYVLSCIKIEI